MAKSYKSYWIPDQNQNGNFSNNQIDTFDPTNDYIGVRLQQGVPLLDRDWNELEDIRRYQEVNFRSQYIGNGTTDLEGFKVVAMASPANDFTIKAGRYLVSGFDVNNPEDKNYLSQGLAALNTPSANSTRTDQVYLEVTIQEIRSTGNTDDPLQNSKDVGMETCIRHKLNWAVKVVEEGLMPPSDQYGHRTLLAVINRTNSPISDDQIIDKRAKLITVGENGRADIWGRANIRGGATIDSGATISGGTTINDGVMVNGGATIIGDATISGKLGIGSATIRDDELYMRVNENIIYLKPDEGLTFRDLLNDAYNWNIYRVSRDLMIRHVSPATSDWENVVRIDQNGNLYTKGMVKQNSPDIDLSDVTFKTKLQPLTNVLDKLENIRSLSFEWNDLYRSLGYDAPVGQKQIGMIAQDVQAVFPELVTKVKPNPLRCSEEDRDKEFLGIDYSRFTAVLLQAVKELKNHNHSLLERIEALEKRMGA